MPTIGDYLRGVYLYLSECLNIFAIDHHHIFLYRNGVVQDITYKIKKFSKIPKSLRFSSYMNINYTYQLYYKLTNKYYIVNTTMNDIINNTVILPNDQHITPRSLFTPKTHVYINGILLSTKDCLYYKNHHPNNILYYVFKFNNIDIKSIVIKDDKKIIKIIDNDFHELTMENIRKYL